MHTYRLIPCLVLVACIQFSGYVHAQETIPSGTIIPVVLPRAIDSQKIKAGQPIVAQVAQDVPVGEKWVIRRNTKVLGKISQIESKPGSHRITLTLQFDRIQLGQAGVPVDMQLRALADVMAIMDAQMRLNPPYDRSVSPYDTTIQVGGDIVYRGGGPVQSLTGEVVGIPTGCMECGVLDMVPSEPGPECAGAVADDTHLQAMWVFSANACGVYGLNGRGVSYFDGLEFQNGSTVSRDGQILFSANDRVKLPGGSGLLLVVTGTATSAAK
jgi:hypothetical protein